MYSDDELAPSNMDEFECYTMRFLGDFYHTTIRACVATQEKHLCNDGHYGVLWLEAVEYENGPMYTENDLLDMLSAFEVAEDNLLRIGIPFTPEYQFHGDKENKKQENEKLREKYQLPELESRKEGILND